MLSTNSRTKSSGYDELVAERMKKLNIITIKQLTDILNEQ